MAYQESADIQVRLLRYMGGIASVVPFGIPMMTLDGWRPIGRMVTCDDHRPPTVGHRPLLRNTTAHLRESPATPGDYLQLDEATMSAQPPAIPPDARINNELYPNVATGVGSAA